MDAIFDPKRAFKKWSGSGARQGIRNLQKTWPAVHGQSWQPD
jgi:hypothetical protein